MGLPSSSALLRNIVEIDLAICRGCNRISYNRAIRHFFRIISRLGDGMFWYTLALLLPLIYGWPGINTSLHMVITGVIAVLIYKLIKNKTGRTRPCHVTWQILPGTDPLDQYSFPSGHTLHATAFSIVALHFHPDLAWLLLPFAGCVAASRIILGLHFPTDVIAGALIGGLIAQLVLAF